MVRLELIAQGPNNFHVVPKEDVRGAVVALQDTDNYVFARLDIPLRAEFPGQDNRPVVGWYIGNP